MTTVSKTFSRSSFFFNAPLVFTVCRNLIPFFGENFCYFRRVYEENRRRADVLLVRRRNCLVAKALKTLWEIKAGLGTIRSLDRGLKKVHGRKDFQIQTRTKQREKTSLTVVSTNVLSNVPIRG